MFTKRIIRSSHRKFSIKKLFLKVCQYSLETPVLESFLYSKYKPSVLGRYQKEVPAQVFFCEYYEIFKNTYFEKICERLLLNNVKQEYSSTKTAK